MPAKLDEGATEGCAPETFCESASFQRRPRCHSNRKAMSQGNKYSILLPTYCERDNLPLIIWLLVDAFKKR
jgi:hypothetical protein